MLENGWFKQMPVILKILEEENVDLVRNPDGSYLRTQGFGQPGHWWINIAGGQTLKRKIARRVRAEGAHVFDYMLVTKLLKSGNHVAGCLAYNHLTGEFYIFKAKKVVCSLGRTVNRVSANSTGNPFNCWHDPYVTGAYYALTYDIGAKIMNMDVAEASHTHTEGLGRARHERYQQHGRSRTECVGRTLHGQVRPMWENGIRRNQIQGTYQELIEGKGPPFYMDMRHFTEEDARHLQYVLMPATRLRTMTICIRKVSASSGTSSKWRSVNWASRAFSGEGQLRDERRWPVQRLRVSVCFRRYLRRLLCGTAGGQGCQIRRQTFRHRHGCCFRREGSGACPSQP